MNSSTPTPKNYMQRNSSIILFSIVAGLILIISLVGYATNGFGLIKPEVNKSDAMTTNDPMMKKEDGMTKSPDAMTKVDSTSGMTAMSKSGSYLPYSASELANAKDGHRVILFFNASWCPTCQATVKDIIANKDKINPNIHILSADYDKETALKQKYGVTYQHTFVEVDSAGNLIKKTIGLGTVQAINDYLK